MLNNQILDDISSRISGLLANSPAQDIEKNVRSFLSSAFARLDLVTREEFDVQKEVLAKTRAKLDALEAQIAVLEAMQKNKA